MDEVNDNLSLLQALLHHEALDVIQDIVRARPGEVQARDADGWLPLHHAALNSSPEVVQCLAREHPQALHDRTPNGELPIHLAARRESPETAQFLAAESPDTLLEKTDDLWTPLHCSARWASLETVRFLAGAEPRALLERSDSEDMEDNESLPLHFAAKRESPDIAEFLAAETPDGLLEKTEDGWTPLHCAACYGSLPTVQLLARLEPRAIHEGSSEECLPLHFAVCSFENTRFLVSESPDSLLAKTEDGLTALHLATLFGSLQTVQFLVRMEPRALKERSYVVGELPLLFGLARGEPSPETVEFLADEWPDALLAKSASGSTPLHGAVHRGSLEVVQVLVRKEPRALRERTNTGMNPLLFAVTREQRLSPGIVEFLSDEWPGALLEKYSLQDYSESQGWTALHLAACRTSLEVVRILTRKEPRALQEPADDGKLPVHIAIGQSALEFYRRSSFQIVQFLTNANPNSASYVGERDEFSPSRGRDRVARSCSIHFQRPAALAAGT